MGHRRPFHESSNREQRLTKPPGKSLVIAVTLAMAVSVLLTGLSVPTRAAAGQAGPARVGEPAPDFTLRLLDGKSVSLSSLKGKPVLVNFWHSG